MAFKYVVRESFHLDGAEVLPGTELDQAKQRELEDAIDLGKKMLDPKFQLPEHVDHAKARVEAHEAAHKLSMCIRVARADNTAPAVAPQVVRPPAPPTPAP